MSNCGRAQLIAVAIAEKAVTSQFFPHAVIPHKDFFQKGVREERHSLFDNDSLISFTGNQNRLFIIIHMICFDPLDFPPAQATGGTEGYNTEIPAG